MTATNNYVANIEIRIILAKIFFDLLSSPS